MANIFFIVKVVDASEGDDIEDGFGCCGSLLIGCSYLLVLFTLPFSLFACVKVNLHFIILS